MIYLVTILLSIVSNKLKYYIPINMNNNQHLCYAECNLVFILFSTLITFNNNPHQPSFRSLFVTSIYSIRRTVYYTISHTISHPHVPRKLLIVNRIHRICLLSVYTRRLCELDDKLLHCHGYCDIPSNNATQRIVLYSPRCIFRFCFNHLHCSYLTTPFIPIKLSQSTESHLMFNTAIRSLHVSISCRCCSLRSSFRLIMCCLTVWFSRVLLLFSSSLHCSPLFVYHL